MAEVLVAVRWVVYISPAGGMVGPLDVRSVVISTQAPYVDAFSAFTEAKDFFTSWSRSEQAGNPYRNLFVLVALPPIRNDYGEVINTSRMTTDYLTRGSLRFWEADSPARLIRGCPGVPKFLELWNRQEGNNG